MNIGIIRRKDGGQTSLVREADIPIGEGSDLLNVWLIYGDEEQYDGGSGITQG